MKTALAILAVVAAAYTALTLWVCRKLDIL